jgi:hypothetical protein
MPPAAGGTNAVAVSKPVQESRPAKPALSATGGASTAAADKYERSGETSAAAAGAARQSSGVSGSRSGYRIPRLISPIRTGYFENF